MHLIFCSIIFFSCVGASTLCGLASRSLNQYEKFTSWIEKELQEGKEVSQRALEGYHKIKKCTRSSLQTLEIKKKTPFSERRVHEELTEKIVRKHVKKISCSKAIPITREMIGSNGYIICKKGAYCLADDICFNPDADNIPAIIIKSDSVVLDLANHTIRQSKKSFNAFQNTSGIEVISGTNNVTIKNGHLVAFANHGIIVQSAHLDPSDHRGIIIQNITVSDCGKPSTSAVRPPLNARSGIGVDGATNVLIKNCSVTGTVSFERTEGISSNFCDTVLIKESEGSSSSAAGPSIGIACNSFDNANIVRCLALKNSDTGELQQFSSGLLTLIGTNLSICMTTANENQSPASCVPLFVNNVTNGNVTSSHADDNRTNGGIGLLLGIECEVVENFTVSDCSSKNNISTVEQEDAQSNNWGIAIDEGAQVVVSNCFVSGNLINASDNIAATLGGIVVADGQDVVVRACFAAGQRAEGSSIIVSGFHALRADQGNFDARRVIFETCTAQNNSAGGTGVNGSGFRFSGYINPVMSECIATGNGVGLTTELGSVFSLPIDTLDGIFDNNKFLANTEFGINDTNTIKTNAYSKNYAYNPLPAINFQGLPSGVPIRSWQIGTPPSPVNNNGVAGDILDNISVTN